MKHKTPELNLLAMPQACDAAALNTVGCTSRRLRQLVRRVDRHYDLEMAKAGLKTTQYSLLSYVLRLGPIRPGELADSLNLSASTLTRNLKPLVDAGWLRLDAGTDARSRLVSITDAGRAKQAEAAQRWIVAQQGLNTLLGAGRVLALHELINDSLEILAGHEATDSDA